MTAALAGPRTWSCCVTGTLSVAMTGLPFIRHSFEGIQDTVRAGIDRDRRAVAPEDHALVVEDEQRALAHAVAFAVGAVALRDGTPWGESPPAAESAGGD